MSPVTNKILEADSTRLLDAVRGLLTARGVLTLEEIADRIRTTDNASPGQGARMVARAWLDPAYRALMLSNGTQAAESLGIPMRGAPPLGVLENAPGLHHLVVCTLCSCYPACRARLSALLVQIRRLPRPRRA